MRTSLVALLSVFFLFISCKDDDNPTGSTGTLIGDWILAKEIETMKVNNVVIESDTSVYLTPAESYLLLAFSASTINIYDRGFDSTYLTQTPYTASGGKLAIMGDSLDYSISGSTLLISQKEEDGDTTYLYNMYLSRYSGKIPPDGWPPLSFEPKEDQLFLERNHKILK